MRQPKSLKHSQRCDVCPANFCVKVCKLAQSYGNPQVLPDRLAGNRIQFAIQVTIHPFCRLFAGHLIFSYRRELPNVL
jgi:hypothetical protein